MIALRPRATRDAGYTLVELLIAVVIIGIMTAVAVGSLAGIVVGLHNSIAQTSLQATRVALAGAAVSTGSVPTKSTTTSGVTTASAAPLTYALVPLPTDDPNFQIGYVPFCYQTLDNTGVATKVTIHPGICTAADTTPGATGAKPLVETDFVLCAQYGATGTVYIADTWHSVQPYVAGGTWQDGSTMDLHGCVPKSITAQGGVVQPQP